MKPSVVGLGPSPAVHTACRTIMQPLYVLRTLTGHILAGSQIHPAGQCRQCRRQSSHSSITGNHRRSVAVITTVVVSRHAASTGMLALTVKAPTCGWTACVTRTRHLVATAPLIAYLLAVFLTLPAKQVHAFEPEENSNIGIIQSHCCTSHLV